MNDKLIKTLNEKLSQSIHRMFTKSIWAGAFISFGCILFLLSTSLLATNNLSKLLGSMLFSIGLFLVLYFKSQLFTGNHLMFINYFYKRTSVKKIARNWLTVYMGNFLGSIVIVLSFIVISEQSELIKNRMHNIVELKTSYSYMICFFKAILCNILVCLGVYFGVTGENLLTKFLGVLIPITLFVFLGFEHSIANMFFLPLGLGLENQTFLSSMTLFFKNIIPVTLGNITGGYFLSIVYLQMRKRAYI